MVGTFTFGEWLIRRRKSLNLTREALARRLPCSASTIRRLEAGDLRASPALAKSLAIALELPENQQADFVAFARGDHSEPTVVSSVPWEAAPVSHLPAPLTSFIGRQREVSAVADALRKPAVRLLTLSGPPGTGKTRLSIAVAQKLMPSFRDGVYFVPLAPVADPQLVAAAIAHVLGIKEAHEGTTRALFEFLCDKNLLLVLDNFEHLMPAAPLVTELLTAALHVKALVTSREVLHLYGEHEFPVPPLELLDVRHLPTTETLSIYTRYTSIKFFRERACAIRPDFRLTRENAADVARICAWLDGLPLAIEIAAAQIKWHTPAQLYSQLQDRLTALTGGPRDLTPRQQSLRGAMDWSYDLLNESERRLFRVLGIFSGGCTEAAICEAYPLIFGAAGDEPQIEILKSKVRDLADKSLLQHGLTPDGESRYFMLETMRDYALNQLKAAGELECVREWHCEYYLNLARQARPHLIQGADMAQWSARLERDYNNLRTALAWAVAAPERASIAMELGWAIHVYWLVHSSFSEARYWLDRILALDPEPSKLRADLLRFASDYASTQGDYSAARGFEEEAMGISKTLNDEPGIFSSMDGLAMLAGMQGDYARAVDLLDQVLTYRRQSNDAARLVITLNNLAIANRRSGQIERARHLYEESIDVCRASQNLRVLASALVGLAEIHADLQEYAFSVGYLRQSLSIDCQLGSLGEHFANALEALAMSTDHLDAASLAVQLEGAASRVRKEVGAALTPAVRAEIENFIMQLRTRLGEQEFERAWKCGQNLSTDQIMDLALDEKQIPSR
jgi:predicted ATPase/transcriptional regulator with XRE-family HTH domain